MEALLKMDVIGSCDPFFVMDFSNASVVSKVIKDTLEPFFFLRCFLPFSEPTLSRYLTIKIFDEDTLGKNPLKYSFIKYLFLIKYTLHTLHLKIEIDIFK